MRPAQRLAGLRGTGRGRANAAWLARGPSTIAGIRAADQSIPDRRSGDPGSPPPRALHYPGPRLTNSTSPRIAMSTSVSRQKATGTAREHQGWRQPSGQPGAVRAVRPTHPLRPRTSVFRGLMRLFCLRCVAGLERRLALVQPGSHCCQVPVLPMVLLALLGSGFSIIPPQKRHARTEQQSESRNQPHLHPPSSALFGGLGLFGFDPCLRLAPRVPLLNGPRLCLGSLQLGSAGASSAFARKSATAFATMPASTGRSAWSGARQRLHSATSSGSAPHESRRSKQSATFPCAALIRMVSAEFDVNGGLPVRMTARIAPSPKTSLRGSIRSIAPSACSGGMYAGVPITLPACVTKPSASRSERISCALAGSYASHSVASPLGRLASTLASPQSMTWTSPKLPTITLPGFKSRWITF